MPMGSSLSHDRLLGIIDAQNEIGSADLRPGETMTLVAARARALTGADAAAIELLGGEEMIFGAAMATGLTGLARHEPGRVSGPPVALEEVVHCRDARADPRVDQAAACRAGIGSMVSVPLRHCGQVLGALKIYSRGPDAFTEEDLGSVQLLAGVLAPHVGHWQASRCRRTESMADPLTGLPARRAFEVRLGAEVARVRRHGGDLSLCLLDVDDFRSVNQTLGRGVGDEVLRAVARNLAHVRGEDEVFRTGADEFAVIFAGVDARRGQVAAERLAAAVQADRGCGGVTVAWGVAGSEGGDPQALLAKATEALERAKRAGSL